VFRLSQIILLIILLSAFILAQSPHGSGLNLDCSVCHNSSDWKVDFKTNKFDHSLTKFPLIGQHSITDCRSCHTDLVFENAQPECISCHTDIHQETVGLDCSRCHTPNSWIVEDINGLHQMNRFALLGQHLSADCVQCHSRYTDLYFEPLDVDCYSCHKENYNSTSFPKHTEAGFSTDCQVCHSINAVDWAGTSIIHDFFPLVGGHTIQDCFACHEQGGNFSGLSTDCYSCHQHNYESTQDPNHIAANFSTDCSLCHTIYGWSPANFDHNQTAFPLTGKHINVNCSDCHTNGYTGTPSDCYSCHQQDYESTNDPNHVAEGFPTDCSLCHNTNGWDDADFDHNQTSFPLTGAHISVSCSNCHSNGYSGTPTDCYSCHQQDYESTTDPNHVAEGFPTDCSQCHNTSSWDDADFDHSQTNFPLTGAHISVSCSGCHSNGYSGTPTDCYSCHQQDYESTTEPNHQAANIQTACDDCHSTSGWSPANFDHSFYPISSHHNNVNCNECHSQSNYQPQCLSCHQDDFNEEHDPGDPTDCWGCHSTSNWDTNFNHNSTNFPLNGAHTSLSCQQCHENGYQGTPTECVACHQNNYNNSTNPNHQTLVLSSECNSCHSTEPGWLPASFPIHDQFYQLLGAHLENADNCTACHNGNYNNTPDQCYGCHQSNFEQAVNPNHTAAGISTDCEPCHNSIDWIPSTFNHTQTGFELLGQHTTLQCSSCHVGTTSGLNSECFSCHQDDYNLAPDHLAQNYPTNCEMCHNANAWNEVTFDHGSTNFPLTGAHISLSCQLCHESGYQGTPTECYACHETNYNNTTNPDHQALSISTDCETCHTTNPNWQPAAFPIHNQFYQLIGAHANISNDCDACHNGNYNSTPNTCFGCHESDFNSTNDPPHQILNFSHECTDCHSQNSWSPANFDHSFYPVSNNHNNVNCNECHSQANYQPQCLSCHMEDFLEEHNLGDPTDCWNCHTTNNWDIDGSNLKLQRID
jgi:hypothetical protein